MEIVNYEKKETVDYGSLHSYALPRTMRVNWLVFDLRTSSCP